MNLARVVVIAVDVKELRDRLRFHAIPHGVISSYCMVNALVTHEAGKAVIPYILFRPFLAQTAEAFAVGGHKQCFLTKAAILSLAIQPSFSSRSGRSFAV